MLKKYKAQIKKNTIEWIDEQPEELKKNHTIIAYVTILKNENKKNASNTLVDFFRNSPLYNSNIEFDRTKDYGREIDL